MRDILKRINRISGIRGTMIIGGDGLVVAADMADDGDPNVLAALASTVVTTLKSSLSRMEEGEISRFLLNGSQGSMALFVVGDTILLTLVRKDANMGMVLVELKEASQELSEAMGG